jgi:hypothetical protein
MLPEELKRFDAGGLGGSKLLGNVVPRNLGTCETRTPVRNLLASRLQSILLGNKLVPKLVHFVLESGKPMLFAENCRIFPVCFKGSLNRLYSVGELVDLLLGGSTATVRFLGLFQCGRTGNSRSRFWRPRERDLPGVMGKLKSNSGVQPATSQGYRAVNHNEKD